MRKVTCLCDLPFVEIREFNGTVEERLTVSKGVPIQLGWNYNPKSFTSTCNPQAILNVVEWGFQLADKEIALVSMRSSVVDSSYYFLCDYLQGTAKVDIQIKAPHLVAAL